MSEESRDAPSSADFPLPSLVEHDPFRSVETVRLRKVDILGDKRPSESVKIVSCL